MPKMTRQGQTLNVRDHQVRAMISAGWEVASERPPDSARKDELASYAAEQGVDVDGMTKPQIIDALNALQ